MKTSKRPNPMKTAIPPDVVAQKLFELVTVVASIPEGERAAWYYSVFDFSRREPEEQSWGFYDTRKIAGSFLRLAHVVWAQWPPQDPENVGADSSPGAPAPEARP